MYVGNHHHVFVLENLKCIQIIVSSHLQSSVKCPLNGYTLAGMSPVGGDSRDERVELIFFLLQLFHQALDGPLGKGFALATLPVTHQAVHDAQACIVAGRRVGDGHLDFTSGLAEKDNEGVVWTQEKYVRCLHHETHHQESTAERIIMEMTKSDSAVLDTDL